MRAQLLESIGLAYRRQGSSDRAIPMFEQAVAIRRDERRTTVIERRGARKPGAGAHRWRTPGFRRSYLQQALDMSRAADETPSRETGDILAQFGQFVLNAKSDPQTATKLSSEALAIYRAAIGNQSLSVASALGDLATAALWTGDFAQAERYQREAMTIFQATVSRNHPDYADRTGDVGLHPDAAG